MATLGFEWTVSAEDKMRIIDGVAGQHGYQEQLDDGEGNLTPNPESKSVFAKRMAKLWVKNNVKAFEANKAAVAARDAKIAEVDEISIE